MTKNNKIFGYKGFIKYELDDVYLKDGKNALFKPQTKGSLCIDLRAVAYKLPPQDKDFTTLDADNACVLKPNKRVLIDVGVKIVEFPRPNAYARVLSRSGLAVDHGVFVLNAPGIIDNDYRGGVCAILHNSGEEDFVIKRGDRVAQMEYFIAPPCTHWEGTIEEDREGGFGSTGIE